MDEKLRASRNRNFICLGTKN